MGIGLGLGSVCTNFGRHLGRNDPRGVAQSLLKLDVGIGLGLGSVCTNFGYPLGRKDPRGVAPLVAET